MNTAAVSESASSETGHCSNVSDSGRVCNTPRSSVLFDGIPTLTGLEGDMWASQLLTLDTSSTSSVNISFDFTKNGLTRFEVLEVVMFNCPARGIGAASIEVFVAGILRASIAVSESCNLLLRACSNTISASGNELTLIFNIPLQYVYLAEITFYSRSGRPCSPGPINKLVHHQVRIYMSIPLVKQVHC